MFLRSGGIDLWRAHVSSLPCKDKYIFPKTEACFLDSRKTCQQVELRGWYSAQKCPQISMFLSRSFVSSSILSYCSRSRRESTRMREKGTETETDRDREILRYWAFIFQWLPSEEASKFPFHPEWEPWILGTCEQTGAWPGSTSQPRNSTCTYISMESQALRASEAEALSQLQGEVSMNEQKAKIFVSFYYIPRLAVTQSRLTKCCLRALALMTRKHPKCSSKEIKIFSCLKSVKMNPSTILVALCSLLIKKKLSFATTLFLIISKPALLWIELLLYLTLSSIYGFSSSESGLSFINNWRFKCWT